MTTLRTYPNLPNAPIKEAIISTSIEQQKHHSLEELDTLCEKLKKTYPQRKNWKIKEFALEEKEEETNISKLEKVAGYVISSEDKKKILHISRDMLSLNLLKPYSSWEDFTNDYKAAWDVFTESLEIEKVKGLTIRYINNFSIPTNDWERYLLMHPNLQSKNDFDDSTISMREVFSRYVLASKRYMAQSVVLLTLKPETNNSLQVIMDIEVVSRTPITDYSGYHDIIDVLNRLRDFKNQIFFSNVPKAEELFS